MWSIYLNFQIANDMCDSQEILVSVCCAAYNHSAYIRQCLDGFIMQKTNFRFEVLIHDDASTDGTQDIIREYEMKYPDIIKPIYQEENQYCKGGKISLRFNIPRAKGKYIAFCEGDDYWIDSLKLQKQVDFMEANSGYSMCFHNSYILQNNKIIGKHRIYRESQEAIIGHVFRDGGFIPTQSILCIRSIYNDIDSFPSNCPVGDLKIQVYCALHGRIYYMNETMAVYRRWGGSATHVIRRNIDKYVLHHKKFIEWYKSVDEYTGYKYHTEIEKSIIFSNARIAIATKDFKEMRNSVYRDYLAYLSPLSRIGMYVRIYGFNWIYILGHKSLSLIRRII